MDSQETILPAPLANTYWVMPRQFLAGEHPGDADEKVMQTRISALINAGIRTFVDLTEESEINEDAKPIVGYYTALRSLADEGRVEITYVRIPVPDRAVPSVSTLRRILDLVDRSMGDENPVFVHCWAGRGRTGTVVGCYLKRHELASDHDVIAKLAQLRRFMPNGRDSSPHTQEQIRMVKTWKKGA
jgi:protein-tyrosine phosphatase